MKTATKVIRAGRSAAKQGESLLPGPTFASMFHCSGDPAEVPFSYGRFHNPTWLALENGLSELEGGSSVLFASGMAASYATLAVTLRPGDTLVIPDDCYYTTRIISEEELASQGVTVRVVRTGHEDVDSCLQGARLLWLESPSNPALTVYDIQRLAEKAHSNGVLLAVDNTTSTPLLQSPLRLGADFSVASDSKALAGHGDLILGHVATQDSGWLERLQTWRTRTGAVPGPMEAWLAHRSLATLDLRLERMSSTAQTIAQLLLGHPLVKRVLYPGLPSHAGHAIASRQMTRFGHIVSFELAGNAQARAFLESCRLIEEATSFGAVISTAEQRARWGGDGVGGGFIRMSLGCEHPEDLTGDILQALEVAAGH